MAIKIAWSSDQIEMGIEPEGKTENPAGFRSSSDHVVSL